jgi:hypothetical protein
MGKRWSREGWQEERTDSTCRSLWDATLVDTSDREALYSLPFVGPATTTGDGEVGPAPARRWDFCGVVGCELEGPLASGVADLNGNAGCKAERGSCDAVLSRIRRMGETGPRHLPL